MIGKPRIFWESILLISWAAIVGSLFAVVDAVGSRVLHFRLPSAQVVHLPSDVAAKSYGESLTALGVATSLESHCKHIDLRVSSSAWLKAEFDSSHHMDEWKRWLESIGFETKSCGWRLR